MLFLANFLSVLPLYYIIFTSIVTLYTLLINSKTKMHIVYYFFGLLVSLFTPDFIKRITKLISPKGNYWYRPKGAKGCDFQSIKGFNAPFTPGFPSGHMTLTTYVMVFNILMTLEKNVKYSNVIIIVNLLFIFAMAWARHFKKCHNIFQILGGIILGSIIAYITLKHTNELKN